MTQGSSESIKSNKNEERNIHHLTLNVKSYDDDLRLQCPIFVPVVCETNLILPEENSSIIEKFN
jgi:hypothetical protein